MADTRTRRALEELRQSVSHLQAAGELLADGLRDGAKALLEGRRGPLAASLNKQVAGRLPVALRSDVEELLARVARLEKRLDGIAKARAA